MRSLLAIALLAALTVTGLAFAQQPSTQASSSQNAKPVKQSGQAPPSQVSSGVPPSSTPSLTQWANSSSGTFGGGQESASGLKNVLTLGQKAVQQNQQQSGNPMLGQVGSKLTVHIPPPTKTPAQKKPKK